MATSANLPAGFSITTISGVRCTAVPRTATTLSGGSATTSSSNVNQSADVNSGQAQKTTTTTSSSTEGPATSTTSIAQAAPPAPAIQLSSISLPPPPASATSAPPNVITTSDTPPPTDSPSLSSTPESTSTAPPATTPASPVPSSTITPSTTLIPVALSDTLPSSSSSLSDGSRQTATGLSSTDLSPAGAFSSSSLSLSSASSSSHSSTATLGAAATSSGTAESSGPDAVSTVVAPGGGKIKTGPVVGGVVGGAAGFVLIGYLLWFFLRRRKSNRRSTLLTPLGESRRDRFYEIDAESVGPTPRSEKLLASAGWQFERVGGAFTGVKGRFAMLGSSLKTKVIGSRNDTPGVNLNRGQSQFLDGPIPQHSRTNSAASGTGGHVTVKDRIGGWIDRFKENPGFNSRLRKGQNEPEDLYATARGMSEKQANLKDNPDFSQLLNMEDRDLQLQAERRRASLAGGSYQSNTVGLGSLGLDFSSGFDPFADPENPFVDSVTQPKPSISKQNNYVRDVRRSRGLSTDMTNQPLGTGIGTGAGGWRSPSTAPASRYPSSIAPSRDSYRDTVFSSFSSNVRRGKGRSDPFDLERPELWRSPPPVPQILGSLAGGIPGDAADTESILVGMARDSAIPNPLALNQPSARVVSVQKPTRESTDTYGSKYSSGISLGGFGDPGPDIGPGSGASSLRENGLYNYVQQSNSNNSMDRSNSIASTVSSKGGVGKAK